MSSLPNTPIIDALEIPSASGKVEPPIYFTGNRRGAWPSLSLPKFQRPAATIASTATTTKTTVSAPASDKACKAPATPSSNRGDLFFYLMDLTASVVAIFMAAIALYRQPSIINGILLAIAGILRYVYLFYRLFIFLL